MKRIWRGIRMMEIGRLEAGEDERETERERKRERGGERGLKENEKQDNDFRGVEEEN